MPNIDSYVIMGMGGFFALLGLVTVLWARREERSHEDTLLHQRDLREFLTHWPERIGPGALRAGALILVCIGLTLIVIGAIFLL
jgi:hypothetical protein